MSNAKKPGSISTTTNPTSTKVTTSAGEVTGQKTMNTIENEEWELGIFTDDDESGGDLSDDEPPIEEQDTISGRPQSQVWKPHRNHIEITMNFLWYLMDYLLVPHGYLYGASETINLNN